MSSRHLRFFVLTAVVALFGVPAALSAGILPPPVEESLSSSSSSGSCVPPSLAVELFTEAAEESGFIFNAPNGEEECEKVCDAFAKTCDDIAHNSRVCNNRGGGKFASLHRKTCSTLTEKDDRRECQAFVDGIRKEVRDCVNEDRYHARDCCEYYAEFVCLADCGAIGDPIDIPFCFTGPGGVIGGSCYFGLANTPL